LRHGLNPYALTFPNIYSDTAYYGPGLTVDGRLQFGFPYPPLSLLLAMPGQLLAADHRYAQLAAVEISAGLMIFARSHGFGSIAAALFLTTPRMLFVLEQGWTEPFIALGLATVLWRACRVPRFVPWLFGLFLALKQYLILAVPGGLLLVRSPRQRLQLVVGASRVVAGVTLPFVIWNPAAFWRSVVTLQLYQPFRPDALSYLS